MLFRELPPDLTDRFLTYVADFDTLWATAQTSQGIYAVFRSRQASIIHAVADNVIAQAHPLAMNACPSNMLEPREEETEAEKSGRAMDLAKQVLRNAQVATELGDIYGLR